MLASKCKALKKTNKKTKTDLKEVISCSNICLFSEKPIKIEL